MIVAAQLMAATDFGVYTYNTAVFGILIPLVYFGLNGILVRALLDADDTSVVINNAIILRGSAFAMVALGLGIAALMNGKLSLLLLLPLFGGLFQVFESFNQAFHKNHITAGVRVGVATAFIAIKIYMLWSGTASINKMLLVFGSEYLAYFCIGFTKSVPPPLRASLARKSEIKALASGGVFMLFSGFAEILNLRVDQIMVAEMIGTAEAGQYAIAAQLVGFPIMFGAVVAAAYFPKFYSGSSDPVTLFRSLRRFNLAMAGFATIFVISLLVVGPTLVQVLFGEQYQPATQIMLYLLPSIYILFFRIVISKWIVVTGIYWYSLFSHSLGAITNIALNFMLIPTMGLNGAVVASMVSYAVACWIALLFSKKTRTYLINAYIG